VGKDPDQAMQAISHRTLKAFFDWMLNQRRGKGGKRLKGVKSSNSLGTYWKVFRLVYERATGSKIDGKTTRKMHRVSCISSIPFDPVSTQRLIERLFSGSAETSQETRINKRETGEDGNVY
jgi:hypothetical protein